MGLHHHARRYCQMKGAWRGTKDRKALSGTARRSAHQGCAGPEWRSARLGSRCVSRELRYYRCASVADNRIGSGMASSAPTAQLAGKCLPPHHPTPHPHPHPP